VKEEGPERWLRLPAGLKRSVDRGTLLAGVGLFVLFTYQWFAGLEAIARLSGWIHLYALPGFGLGFDPVSALLLVFFGLTFVRMLGLDALLRRVQGQAS
jgi:hypothetical protein